MDDSTLKIDYSMRVEEYAKENDITLIESCMIIADEMEIDESDIPKYIHWVLKEKIRSESIQNRTLRVEQEDSLEFLFDDKTKATI